LASAVILISWGWVGSGGTSSGFWEILETFLDWGDFSGGCWTPFNFLGSPGMFLSFPGFQAASYGFSLFIPGFGSRFYFLGLLL
jgi:hypothetical protein